MKSINYCSLFSYSASSSYLSPASSTENMSFHLLYSSYSFFSSSSFFFLSSSYLYLSSSYLSNSSSSSFLSYSSLLCYSASLYCLIASLIFSFSYLFCSLCNSFFDSLTSILTIYQSNKCKIPGSFILSSSLLNYYLLNVGS
jgi:hypothetical protein